MRETGMRVGQSLTGVLCVLALGLGVGAGPAGAAPPEPDFVFTPNPAGLPPQPELEGPCGLAVDSVGRQYVANYYRHSIDIYAGLSTLLTQITNVDPLDGPCGLALDATNRLYVNNYHRNIERYAPVGGGFGPPTVIDSSHPTGVAVDPSTDAVYVNARTHIAAYDSSGAPLLDEGEPLRIGEGSLLDGYGLAVSDFSLTAGRLYVPDWADNTVKVYDPAVNIDDPVQTIDGPPGGFASLRDSAVAVDRVTGEVYVADTLAYPQYSERPEATIHVFEHTGAHKGRLKYNIVDGSPPGLAVDNSKDAEDENLPGPNQGRVYVTSGNTIKAGIYAYPPGSATTQSGPALLSLALSAGGSGAGSISSEPAGIDCEAACEIELLTHSKIPLTAEPEQGSVFSGWSGGGCEGEEGTCTVSMTQARSVSAEFAALSGPPAPPAEPAPAPSPGASAAAPAAAPAPRRANTSVITQKGKLRVAVSGSLAPRRLPRRGAAPISVSVGGQISTTDQSLPPKLKSLRVELNRNGRLDYRGLPTCNYNRIQPGSSSRALSACRSALVGRGTFTANITLAGQEPYPTKGTLLLFNGRQRGKPVLFGHIFSPRPFATSFVIVFKLQKLGKGTYGTALNAPLPRAMDAWGRLTGLQMTLKRRYSFRGARRSFISAGCPAPKGFPGASFPLARTSFSFEGGRKLAPVLISSCKARG